MKPINGTYRITTDATPENPSTTVVYHVTDAGIPCTFGLLKWEEEGDCFRKGAIAIRFVDPTHIVAFNGVSTPITGTAERIGD